eukprot:CAMPEP_0119299698 /NCGR_PEP_ID=MMETSP1333-20130426/1739_1 /TAXON_ID=418940 /ORGANISM="Scyphosphaera apsteinii, Strain RCC1455" /LENGTH=100 /DNA_ID=CAMNT_0007301207 /DNA_START=349 /DNA_END=651 /DNA_ORIENTATION=-
MAQHRTSWQRMTKHGRIQTHSPIHPAPHHTTPNTLVAPHCNLPDPPHTHAAGATDHMTDRTTDRMPHARPHNHPHNHAHDHAHDHPSTQQPKHAPLTPPA